MNRRDFFRVSSSGVAMAAGAAPALAARGARGESLSAAAFGAIGDGEADDTAALQSALDAIAAAPRAGILVVPPGEYRITRPLRLDLKRKRTDGVWGISAYGARLRSRISDGSDVLTVDSTTVARFFLIEGLSVRGSGRDGDGFAFHCDGQGHYLYNAALRDVVAEGCGGDGCRMIGNIFESQLINCYFRDNGRNGMTLGHGRDGGVLSALHVFGCVFGGNGRHGAALIRRTNDVSFSGCYFLENAKYGLVAANGCALLAHSGFENNHDSAAGFDDGGAGLRLNVSGTLIGCTAYSIRNQTHLVSGYIRNQLVMVGCTASGGGRAGKAGLAYLKGDRSAEATIIGSTGTVQNEGGLALTELGRRGFGARFGDRWDSGNLVRLGDHTLWVDAGGALRIKKGRPASDTDGRPAGAGDGG